MTAHRGGPKLTIWLEPKEGYVMDRKAWDQLVSTAAVVLAVTLIVLGGLAIYGGHFGQQNVRDRLTPEKVTFPPYAAMTPAEQQEVGTFAGQQVTDGAQAEAFSRYIEGHLQGVNGGQTYSQTSNAARAEGLDPQVAAELQGKADTLFKGETLRAILLNAYGWWIVATIALYAGYTLLAAGILLGIFAFLGFRHAKRAAVQVAKSTVVPEKERTLQNA
jgi:hypothetical protein